MIAAKRSLPLHQKLAELKLSDGLIGVSGTRERVRLFLSPGSALGRALREWPDAADELAIALGSFGWFIATNETPVVLLKSRGPNRD